MKRIVSALAAIVLTASIGVVGSQPAVAAPDAKPVVPAGSVINPDGKVVKKLPALKGSKTVSGSKVFKGLPKKPGGISASTVCNGVTGPACYLYNVGSQGSVSKNGIQANVRIGGHQGALNGATDYHTLGEIAVQSADEQQVVELGWTVDPSINKTNGVGVYQPRPFVYSWVNNVGGVYNGGGFVPVSGATVVPGVTTLTAGTVVLLTVFHLDTGGGAWWFGWGGEWIGYYPDSQWENATPAVTTFKKLEFTQLFGEIASTELKPCSDMGLGVLPTNTTDSARFSSAAYLNADQTLDTASVNLYVRPNPSVNAGSPYAGTAGSGSPPSTTNLRSFYYGGPMWNAAGTAVGVKGNPC